jgi:futalosine hydrolase
VHVLYVYAAVAEAGPLPAELSGDDAEFLETGVGKTASTFVLTERLQRGPAPDLVVSFGVCGAHSTLRVGDLCLVGTDCLADEGVQTRTHFLDLLKSSFAMDEALTAHLAELLGGLPIVAGSTVSTCSGEDSVAKALVERTGAVVETMEGAAIALVCRRSGVPMVQLRCVSNRTGDRERGGWDLVTACANLQSAVRRIPSLLQS